MCWVRLQALTQPFMCPLIKSLDAKCEGRCGWEDSCFRLLAEMSARGVRVVEAEADADDLARGNWRVDWIGGILNESRKVIVKNKCERWSAIETGIRTESGR